MFIAIIYWSTSVWHYSFYNNYFSDLNILVTIRKHKICPDYIIIFNKELYLLSTLIIELVNIDGYSHEEDVLILITNKDLNMKNIYIIESNNGNFFEWLYSVKSIYNDPIRFMISWWVTYSYFNNDRVQIVHTKIMTTAYGSLVSFVSRLRSKYIGHNTYIGKIINLCSKPTPIYGPIQKYDLNHSYWRSHVSVLTILEE